MNQEQNQPPERVVICPLCATINHTSMFAVRCRHCGTLFDTTTGCSMETDSDKP